MNFNLTLERTSYTIDQLLDSETPQVALAGRSNVGKSSTINYLAGTKKLAKISASPGKTRSINYFMVNPQGFYLVDLPGYGYARRSKEERSKWAQLIDKYFERNESLKAVVVLLDANVEPQRLDLEMISYVLNRQIRLIPVLTKADKCNQSERGKAQRSWKQILQSTHNPLLFSAKTGLGGDKLLNLIIEAAIM